MTQHGVSRADYKAKCLARKEEVHGTVFRMPCFHCVTTQRHLDFSSCLLSWQAKAAEEQKKLGKLRAGVAGVMKMVIKIR